MGCTTSHLLVEDTAASILTTLLGYSMPYSDAPCPTFTDQGATGILAAMRQIFDQRHDRPMIKPLDLCGFIVGRGLDAGVDPVLMQLVQERKVPHTRCH